MERTEPVEVHGYVGESFAVTLHRSPSAAFERARADAALRSLLAGDPIRILHRLTTDLHSDYPPCIDSLDERLSKLAIEVLRNPDDEHLIEIAELNQLAASLRRTLTPGRDLTARIETLHTLPGADQESEPYLHDLSDDLHQIVADLEALEERCIAVLELHASLASNRLSSASRQLAVVATIFLPITFLVGFFGQNFSVLTNTIAQGWLAFLLLGVSLSVLSVVGTVALLGRRGLR